jgi:hypothetical protein
MQHHTKYTNSHLLPETYPPLGGQGGKNEKNSRQGGQKKSNAIIWAKRQSRIDESLFLYLCITFKL